MRKILTALAVSSLVASPALADWTGKDASGATITFKNAGACTSVVCVPAAQPIDSTGASFGVSGNPFFVSLAASAAVDGWDVTQGAKADAICATATGTCSVISLLKFLNTAAGSAMPAGGNIVGKFGIDQTTDGTTNAVHLVAGTAIAGKFGIDQTTDGTTNKVNIGPVGSGVQATAPRMTLATDSPGIVTLGQTTKSASVPVTIASDQGSIGALSSQYPSGATPVTASATGTTAATTATLAATVSVTNYICGFSMRSVATAAAAGNATVTGTISGTLNFTHGTGATPTVIPNDQRFNPCIPASAVNTAIAVVSPAAGTGGAMSVTVWGYRL